MSILYFADENGKTALMYAAAKGYLEITSLLLEAGADGRIVDKSRKSASDYASDFGYLNFIKFKAQLALS